MGVARLLQLIHLSSFKNRLVEITIFMGYESTTTAQATAFGY